MNNEIRDNIVYAIHQINLIRNEKPGKKILQKLLYLAQAEGVDLDLDYGIHFYGPYSAGLDSKIAMLSEDNIICFEYKGQSHLMNINNSYDVRSSLKPVDEQRLLNLIEKYKNKTPIELELITTTHYVKENLPATDEQSIIAGVKKIKGNKYNEESIKNVISEMNLLTV